MTTEQASVTVRSQPRSYMRIKLAQVFEAIGPICRFLSWTCSELDSTVDANRLKERSVKAGLLNESYPVSWKTLEQAAKCEGQFIWLDLVGTNQVGEVSETYQVYYFDGGETQISCPYSEVNRIYFELLRLDPLDVIYLGGTIRE